MIEKSNKNIFSLNFLAFILISVFTVTLGSSNSQETLLTIIGSLCLFACCGSVYLAFTHASKSGDYSALAGFSKKKSYNYDILNKMIIQIENSILWSTFIFQMAIFFFSFFKGMNGMLLFWITMAYTANTGIIIYGFNYKYRSEITNKVNI